MGPRRAQVATVVLATANLVASYSLPYLVSRADRSCPENGYTTPQGSGLTFDVHCNQNQPFWDLLEFGSDTDTIPPDTKDNIQQCMESCATIRPLCYGIVFNYENGDCWYKNNTFTYQSDAVVEDTTHLAIARKSQLEPNPPYEETCPFKNGSTQFTSNFNDAKYTIHCNQDINGADYSPGSAINGLYHASSLQECMDYCTQSSTLCTGVAFNPDMKKGYGNCYPKFDIKDGFSASGPNSAGASLNGVLHSAVLQLPEIKESCTEDDLIKSDDGTRYTTHCNSDRPGNDLVAFHENSLADCLNSCGDFTTAKCQGVVFDSKMTNGYQNCYLKGSFGAPKGGRPGYISAQQTNSTGAADNDNDGDGGSGSSGSNGSDTSAGDGDGSDNGSGGISGGAIAGIVIGAIAALALVAAAAFLLLRKRRNRQRNASILTEPEKYNSHAGIAYDPLHNTVGHGGGGGGVYGTAPTTAVGTPGGPQHEAYGVYGVYSQDAKIVPLREEPVQELPAGGGADGEPASRPQEMGSDQVVRHELPGT